MDALLNCLPDKAQSPLIVAVIVERLPCANARLASLSIQILTLRQLRFDTIRAHDRKIMDAVGHPGVFPLNGANRAT
jgi:hypothetical protein